MAATKQRSVKRSVPAPVGGLNARDSISEMPPTDAVLMVNWFPQTTALQVRNGSVSWATGLPGWVDSLLPYSLQNGSNKLFACSGAGIYDVTSPGAVGAAVVTGQTSARAQSTNFGNVAAQWMYVVTGNDFPQLYSGSTWQQVTNASSPISLTGGPSNLQSLIQVYTWQGRLLFIEANSCRFHILPVLQVGGAFSTIDLASQFTMGGYLMAFADWNALTMTGPLDYAAFISSNGEVLIYQGNDPTLPGAWSLTGRFRIGRPIGRRCCVKVGADVYVLTVDGLSCLSQSQLDERSQIGVEAVTSKIRNLINSDVQAYGGNFGWQPILHPIGNKLILNVPQVNESIQYQYVRQQLTGAWTKFTGWNASCWALMGDQLFYGGNQVVIEADTGENDLGVPIQTDLVPAFNYFGDEGTLKTFGMVRPIFYSDAPITATFALQTDFAITPPIASLGTPVAGKPQWNVALWNVSYWQSGPSVRLAWEGVLGKGFCASLRLQTASTSAQVQLYSIDYMMVPGEGI
jgi:hypothetical protein